MYAFRKPLTAATFDGEGLGPIALKTLFIGAQALGYTASKFLSIRVVSAMPPARRAAAILGLIGAAECALLLFALTPAPWSALWLFCNGLPLGMVFGLVMGFLEGRRQTEALAAGLCASFIVSSGVVKSVGRSLIVDHGVTEAWMPAATGALFIAPLLLCVALLAQIPPPDEADVEARAARPSMNARDRRAFYARHALGIVGLVATYLLLTVGRSLRDDFAVEIWRELGEAEKPSIFATTETLVMLCVLGISGATVRIRSNRRAFFASLGICAMGFAVLGLAVLMLTLDALSPLAFMVLSGVGLYVPYVAFHTTVFERLISVSRQRANIGYLMYIADAFGYLGYVAVMVARNLFEGSGGFLRLYIVTALVVAGGCTVAIILVGRYFARHFDSATSPAGALEGGPAHEHH